MKIVEYSKYDDKGRLLSYLKDCDWGAGKTLYNLLYNEKFYELLGTGGKVFFLMDEENVVSFLTLTNQDCIDDKSLSPWIGFVYTDSSYRGHRYSEKLIKHALETAKKQGYCRVYLGTDHVGLYEKYGFHYIENMIDLYNEKCRIYGIDI